MRQIYPFKKCRECKYYQKEAYCKVGYYPDSLDWCPYNYTGDNE